MKVFNLILFLLTNEVVEGQRCTNTAVRKEMKTLSEAERAAYFNAYRTMMAREPYRSQFTKMVDNHYNAGNRAHNSPFFFPWHREFLRDIERLLQKIDSSVILPYCNWSEYSSNPEDSYMFTDKYFGGNGSGNSSCINSGIFKGVTVDFPKKNKCIQREWNGGNKIGSFSSKAAIQITLNKKVPYDRFRAEVEGSIHSRVHVNLGGKSGDLAKMASPNDPFFTCHHAFIDYLWAEWQVKRGKDGMEFGGNGVTKSSTMWPWGKRVSDVLDTKNPGLCYVYDSHYKGDHVSVQSINSLVNPDKPLKKVPDDDDDDNDDNENESEDENENENENDEVEKGDDNENEDSENGEVSEDSENNESNGDGDEGDGEGESEGESEGEDEDEDDTESSSSNKLKAASIPDNPVQPRRKKAGKFRPKSRGRFKPKGRGRKRPRRREVKKLILKRVTSAKFIDKDSNDLNKVALMILNGTKNGVKVGCMERGVDKDLAKSCDPVPEEWLNMMGIDVLEQREREVEMDAYVQAYNLVKVSKKPKYSIKKPGYQKRFQAEDKILDQVFESFTNNDNMHIGKKA